VNELAERLSRAFDDEPATGDAVDAVFRRVERTRRRRIRRVILGGLAAVVLVAAVGYGLTDVLLPAPVKRAAPTPTASAGDPVLAALARVGGVRVSPRSPPRGSGWRLYTAVDERGLARGMILVVVYTVPGTFCLPVLADKRACALLESAPGNRQYARYSWDDNIDWQVNEAIARRVPDGRTVAVMATGQRGTADAETGRPPLTALQAAAAATDPALMNGFAATERCGDKIPGCPLLRVKVPAAG
jgi:hypothetical protein